jgi:serine/threonine protein kinase
MELVPYQHIIINEFEYLVNPHPYFSGFSYVQEGRKSLVYQIKSVTGELFALKILKHAYRLPYLKRVNPLLEKISRKEEFLAAKRILITKENNYSLIKKLPFIEFASLMPWIHGNTWLEYLSYQKDVSAIQGKKLALRLSNALKDLEASVISHTDLSNTNLIIDLPKNSIGITGLDFVFSNEIPPPPFEVFGTRGYQHRKQPNTWNQDGDRFSSAILITELLCWCHKEIRENAWGESYFNQDEIGTNCDRYKLILNHLERLDSEIKQLFKLAWNSISLNECPTINDWYLALCSLNF